VNRLRIVAGEVVLQIFVAVEAGVVADVIRGLGFSGGRGCNVRCLDFGRDGGLDVRFRLYLVRLDSRGQQQRQEQQRCRRTEPAPRKTPARSRRGLCSSL